MRLVFISVILCLPTFAANIRQASLGEAANEQGCSVSRLTSVFQPTTRQVFFQFVAQQVKSGDQLRVDWLDPQGAVAASTPYTDIPDAPTLCFLTQLPISGFPPASQPGLWSVRVVVNEQVILTKPFTVAGDPNPDLLRVSLVTRRFATEKETDFILDGAGFESNSIIHIAQYTKTGGWTYLAALFPLTARANQVIVRYKSLPAGEYLAIVRNPDDRLSKPTRFLVATASSYKLPTVSGEPWVLTQGPYGSFSHWNNTLHAFDIAPQAGRCIVAMRSGVAFTHDLGLRQTPNQRTFGNYITIDHGDGEYSHYGHLASGTFVVKNGQTVEQGQALATVGNSGYTLGEGGGYHVHVQVTNALPIYSPSIPFQFEDLPDFRPRSTPRTIASTNASALCDCKRSLPQPGDGKQLVGSVVVAQWWNEIATVPTGSRSLDISLAWEGADRDLDLHLVSPSGKHYGWYGETAGYSGKKTNPEQFHIVNPESGQWRVSVEGIQGDARPIEFRIASNTGKAGGAPSRPVHTNAFAVHHAGLAAKPTQ